MSWVYTVTCITVLVIGAVRSKQLPDKCYEPLEEACSSEPDKHKDYIIRWYYDGAICSPYIFVGCGNSSHYETEDECRSECPDYYDEDIYKPSDWPDGPYAIPMSIYGCPEIDDKGWRAGYINMTFRSKVTEDVEEIKNAQRSRLLGPYSENVVQLNFCFKLPSDSDVTPNSPAVNWPSGNYGIYRAKGACPAEFTEGNLSFNYQHLLHKNMDGELPDFTMNEVGSGTELTIYTCYRDREAPGVMQNITANWSYTFILLQGTRSTTESYGNCPDLAAPGLSVVEESNNLLQTRQYLSDGNAENASFKYCLYVDTALLLPGNMTLQTISQGNFSMKGIRPVFIPQESKTEYKAGTYQNSFEKSWTLFRKNGIQFHPLPVYTKERYETPYILIDLEQTITIRHVIIYYVLEHMKWKQDLKIQGKPYFNSYTDEPPFYIDANWSTSLDNLVTLDDAPRIIVGHDKWALLKNGGLTCQNNPTQLSDLPFVVLKCTRPLRGRYLALIAAGDKARLFLKDLESIFVSGDLTGYGKDLGMHDGSVYDFQIVASTERDGHSAHFSRPGFPGWCAATDDIMAYLQVDFLQNITLEGITIFNWGVTKSYHNESIYIKEHIPFGIRSFTLEYGYDINNLNYYEDTAGNIKIFSLDKFQPYDSVQSFHLLKPLLASKLRIHPTSVTGSQTAPCMKIELIGNREKQRNTRYPILYSELDWMFKSYQSINVVTEPGVITNRGYPAYYNTGTLEEWVIKLEDGCQLVFTNISLNEYEFEYDPEHLGRKCKDRIVIHEPFATQTYLKRQFPSLTYEAVDGYDKVVLDSTFNNKQRLYNTVFPELRILFYTCYRQDSFIKRGYGFRAVVKQGGKRECKSTMKQCTVSDETSSAVYLVSESFTTTEFISYETEVWHIQGYSRTHSTEHKRLGYLVLIFTDFEISCDQGSTLEITVDNTKQSFCNLQRPIDSFYSASIYINIRFVKSCQKLQTSFAEGFRAEYKIQKHNSYIEDMSVEEIDAEENIQDISNQDFLEEYENIPESFLPPDDPNSVTEQGLHTFLEVCSASLGKCYRFLGTDVKITSWQALKYCLPNSHTQQRLLQIQTKAENDFIVYHLLYRIEIRVPVHIAFYSFVDENNKFQERRYDGNPVTFTAWKPGQFKFKHSTLCAILNPDVLMEESWETVDCDEPTTVAFVCEYPRVAREQTNRHRFLIENETLSGLQPKHKLFRCETKEFISRLHVCDSQQDCLDGSDEADCSDTTESGCPPGDFFSLGDKCIRISACCDFVRDNLDGSDEFCEFADCKTSEFKCDNGQCIPIKSRCDLRVDCFDGSDETDCDLCNGDTFKCNTGSICIPSSRICDGFDDCNGGEDEAVCAQTSLSSCKEAWERGFRKNGKYTIGGNDVECNFDNIFTTNVIYTVYHDIDIDYGSSVDANNDAAEYTYWNIQYGSRDFVSSLFRSNSVCSQSVLQTCHPPLDNMVNMTEEEDYQCSTCRTSYQWLDGSLRFNI